MEIFIICIQAVVIIIMCVLLVQDGKNFILSDSNTDIAAPVCIILGQLLNYVFCAVYMHENSFMIYANVVAIFVLIGAFVGGILHTLYTRQNELLDE